ncbi:hypothetical protein CPSG_09677 [Coccidioides posadasii str. Silveira]|uniref:Uncharacterized protein n=1 Tax=Coccidioides posadasii (strain RMSCC 757 / Silveira) TaxID=443226 RepID=E9DIN4_COCPS|nr:hypothetical protein CPSG_09677 [Coccidioides posadasii str. Silveira]
MHHPSAVHVGEPSKDKRPAIQPNAQKFMPRITALKLMSNFSSMCWNAGAYIFVCLLERDVIICVLEHNDTEDRILLTFLPVQRIQGVCRRLWKHCPFHSRTLRSTYVYVGIIPSIFRLGYALLLSPFGGLSLDCSGLIIALSAFSVNFKIGLCKCSQCGTKIDSRSTHIWCSSVVS